VTTIAVSSVDNEIFASEGATVTINCTVNSTEGLIWEYSVFSEKLIFKKIALKVALSTIKPTNLIKY
jgi:hypothetical protein